MKQKVVVRVSGVKQQSKSLLPTSKNRLLLNLNLKLPDKQTEVAELTLKS